MTKAISSKYKNMYQENGYLLINNVLNDTEVKKAQSAIDMILTNAKNLPANSVEFEAEDPSICQRIWNVSQFDKIFEHISRKTKLLDLVELLIGKNIVCQYAKVNIKAPKIGSLVDWHQDFAYYPHTNTDILTCIIYLDDANIDNGCLKVIKKSQQFGLIDHSDNDNFFCGKILKPFNQLKKSDLIYCDAPAGSAVILHGLVVHGSDKNLSLHPRRVLIISYRASDCFPIYFGIHSDRIIEHEKNIKIVRGQESKYARVESNSWKLPISRKLFSSIYRLQADSK